MKSLNWSLSKDAAGITPNQEEIDWRGVIFLMSPDIFLKMAEHLTYANEKHGSIDYMRDALNSGEKVCPPMLSINWIKSTPRVISHDGRHRATLMKELGVKLIPVTIFLHDDFTPIKGKSLTEQSIHNILSCPVLTEDGKTSNLLPVRSFYFRGNAYFKEFDKWSKVESSAEEFLKNSICTGNAKISRNSSREILAISYLNELINKGKSDTRFRTIGSGSYAIAILDIESGKVYTFVYRSQNGFIDLSREVMILARKICRKESLPHFPAIARFHHDKDLNLVIYKSDYYIVTTTDIAKTLIEYGSKRPIYPNFLTPDKPIQLAIWSIYAAAHILGLKVSLDFREGNFAVPVEPVNGEWPTILLDPIACITNSRTIPKVGKLKELYLRLDGFPWNKIKEV